MSEESRQFAIQKIYLKDASFESPKSPMIFTSNELQPGINVQLNSSNQAIAEEAYEVVLDITVTAKINKSTAFLVEVKQAGIFSIVGYSKEDIDVMVGTFCLETLFPYAREAISDLISKGGFPSFILAPVNFSAAFTEHAEQKAAVSSDQEATH